MGAHTVIDLIAGLVLSMGIIGVYLLVGDAVDTFLATSPWVPLVVPAVAIALLYIYPYNNIWSESYGDTACFLGEPLLTHIHNKAHLPLPLSYLLYIAVGTGGMLIHWSLGTPALVPGTVPEPGLVSMSNIGMHILRCLIGYVAIVCCRAVVKQICLFVVPRLVLNPQNEYRFNKPLTIEVPSSSSSEATALSDKEKLYWKYFLGGYHQNYAVEIPTKLITYSIIAYYAALTDPLCDYFGLRL